MKVGKQILGLVLITLFIGINVNDAKLVKITENNWERHLSSGEWMIKFYAPWCPACTRFESVWKEFSDKSDELVIQVGSADVNEYPVLSSLFSVTSLPTIYHIKDGQYRVFNGNRDLNNLIDFIKNKEWKEIEPSSSWLTPNSFLIKMLSILFKATLYFKDLYTYLTESYGLPVWAVLGLFVVITILIGLSLGVALIVFIDCIFPPKKYTSEELNEHIKQDVDDEDENDEQDIQKKTNDNETSTKQRRKVKKDN